MAVFEYSGILAANGKSVKGVRDADSVKALRGVLRKDGILLTTATEEKAARAKQGGSINLRRLFDKPSVADVAMMTRQLSTLIRAKIPLFEALTALIDQVEKDGLKRALTNIRDQVKEGIPFGDALAAHPARLSTALASRLWCLGTSGKSETSCSRIDLA